MLWCKVHPKWYVCPPNQPESEARLVRAGSLALAGVVSSEEVKTKGSFLKSSEVYIVSGKGRSPKPWNIWSSVLGASPSEAWSGDSWEDFDFSREVVSSGAIYPSRCFSARLANSSSCVEDGEGEVWRGAVGIPEPSPVSGTTSTGGMYAYGTVPCPMLRKTDSSPWKWRYSSLRVSSIVKNFWSPLRSRCIRSKNTWSDICLGLSTANKKENKSRWWFKCIEPGFRKSVLYLILSTSWRIQAVASHRTILIWNLQLYC